MHLRTANIDRVGAFYVDLAVPFGGVKASGFGREYGPEALAAYTKTKSVVTSLD